MKPITYTDPILKEIKYYSNGNVEFIAISYREGLIVREFFEEVDEETGVLKIKSFTSYQNQVIEYDNGEKDIILNKVRKTLWDKLGHVESVFEFNNSYCDDYTSHNVNIEKNEPFENCFKQTEYYNSYQVKKVEYFDPYYHEDYYEYYNNGRLKIEKYNDVSDIYEYSQKFEFYKDFPINTRCFDINGNVEYVLYFDIHPKYRDLYLMKLKNKEDYYDNEGEDYYDNEGEDYYDNEGEEYYDNEDEDYYDSEDYYETHFKLESIKYCKHCTEDDYMSTYILNFKVPIEN